MKTEAKHASPCIKECALNKDKVCLGCRRSIDEIVSWMSMSDEQRTHIAAECDSLKTRLGITRSI